MSDHPLLADHPAPRAAQRQTTATQVAGLLVVLAYLGLIYLRGTNPGGLFLVDVPLALLCGYALLDMSRRSSPGLTMLRRISPWWWLIVFASLLALSQDGLTGWAVLALAKSTFALLCFVSMIHVLWVQRLERAALTATAIALGTTVSLLVLFPGDLLRPKATFLHPNYAAHYCFLAGATLFFCHPRRSIRVFGLVGGLIGIYQTASFGAMAMVGVALIAYLAVQRPPLWLPILLATVVFGGYFGTQNWNQGDIDVGDSITSERLERSQDGRNRIWATGIEEWQHDPLGVGPDGVASKGVGGRIGQEAHSDYLGFLIERGLLGLIGLAGLWVAVWRQLPRRSGARVLVVALLAGGIFRETLNYRHLWLLLALTLVAELRAQVAEKTPLEVEAA